MRRPSKWIVREMQKMDIEHEMKRREEKKQYYLSREPVYHILFDDGKRYWIDERGNTKISELSFVSLWGGQEHFTKEEIMAINPDYMDYAKRYLG